MCRPNARTAARGQCGKPARSGTYGYQIGLPTESGCYFRRAQGLLALVTFLGSAQGLIRYQCRLLPPSSLKFLPPSHRMGGGSPIRRMKLASMRFTSFRSPTRTPQSGPYQREVEASRGGPTTEGSCSTATARGTWWLPKWRLLRVSRPAARPYSFPPRNFSPTAWLRSMRWQPTTAVS